ncbi:hypothetical protein JNUCC0626_19860 [Lentzea sp. JNUCC 0626]|uniref:hypothetical protein n=1 Tax=Lentzea sp. JNUCC 0626 TaxID=3367513 RepID=UPI0037495DC7
MTCRTCGMTGKHTTSCKTTASTTRTRVTAPGRGVYADPIAVGFDVTTPIDSPAEPCPPSDPGPSCTPDGGTTW